MLLTYVKFTAQAEGIPELFSCSQVCQVPQTWKSVSKLTKSFHGWELAIFEECPLKCDSEYCSLSVLSPQAKVYKNCEDTLLSNLWISDILVTLLSGIIIYCALLIWRPHCTHHKTHKIAKDYKKELSHS
jgi:hypothetical protein